MSAQEAPNGLPSESSTHSVRGNRIEAATVVVICTGVLAAAWLLTPSPDGVGTHEQVLLLPCGFRWLTGLPCPLCGMTTALAQMARGDLLAALRAHVLGPAVYVGVWLLGLRGVVGLARGTPALPRRLQGAAAARALLAIVLLGWMANIAVHLRG